jgi:predicted GNAT family acetyltransferase
MDFAVVDKPAQNRYEARGPAGELLGHADYQSAPSLVVFTHTEVDSAYEGQGVGSALAQQALDDVRSKGLQVLPLCPFIKDWIDRHREYAPLLYRSRPSTVTD